jgi:hypothetical protein
MIGLLLESQRCLDGVVLTDGFFQPRSERRQPGRLVTTDLEDPTVVQFVNARDDLVPFLSRYTTGSLVPIGDYSYTGMLTPTIAPHRVDTVAGYPRDTVEVAESNALNLITFWQARLRECLVAAGGPDPVGALVALSYPPIQTMITFHLGDADAKPQMLVQCKNLLDFMRMETSMVALEGAKIASCAHCPNIFITGAATTRRAHAIYCSDRCRVAAMRKRKMGGTHEHS